MGRECHVGSRTIAQLIEYHADQINHPDPHLAADFAYRTLFALATQAVMFDDPEVSPLGYRTQTREQQTAHLLLAYLQTHQAETAEKVGSDPARGQRHR